MVTILLALLLQGAAPAADAPPVASARATGTQAPEGGSLETAYVVGGISEEYAILRKRGLNSTMQQLRLVKGRPYDVLIATDPATGAPMEVWFDISSFFGKGLGG